MPEDGSHIEKAEKLHEKTLQNLAPNFEGLKVKIFEAA
jgi:hypothetical protein